MLRKPILGSFRRQLGLLLVSIFVLSAVAQAQIEITLKKAFVEKFKNRVTIDAPFTVDKAHKNVNPPSKDGDMHIAGLARRLALRPLQSS